MLCGSRDAAGDIKFGAYDLAGGANLTGMFYPTEVSRDPRSPYSRTDLMGEGGNSRKTFLPHASPARNNAFCCIQLDRFWRWSLERNTSYAFLFTERLDLRYHPYGFHRDYDGRPFSLRWHASATQR